MRADPRFVDAIVDWRWTGFLARLALVGAYLLGGVVKATDWSSAVAEQAHFGMAPPAFWAALTIGVEIIGPLLILSGRFVWFGAGMLGVFMLLAVFTANAFWSMPVGPERFMATNAFFEHLDLIGGFILAAIVAARDNGRAWVALLALALAGRAQAQAKEARQPPTLRSRATMKTGAPTRCRRTG